MGYNDHMDNCRPEMTTNDTMTIAVGELLVAPRRYGTPDGFVLEPIPLGQLIEEDEFIDEHGRSRNTWSCCDEGAAFREYRWNNRITYTKRFWRVIETPSPRLFDVEEIDDDAFDSSPSDPAGIGAGRYRHSVGYDHYYSDVPAILASDRLTLQVVPTE